MRWTHPHLPDDECGHVGEGVSEGALRRVHWQDKLIGCVLVGCVLIGCVLIGCIGKIN